MIREMLAAAMCAAVLVGCSSTPAPTAASSTPASTPASSLPLVDADGLQACGQLAPMMDQYLGVLEEPDFEEFADRLLDEILPVAPDDLAPLVQELSRTARQQPDETEIPALISAMQAVNAYCGFDGATG